MGKIITMESDSTTAKLLKSLSVMDNLLEVFQELNKSSFQYKKHLLGVVSRAELKSDIDTSVAGVCFLLSYDFNKSSVSQKSSWANCLSPGRSK